MFNNCDSNTNGERLFYNKIKPYIDVIFDVGCRNDSEFTSFNGIVHYFDPVSEFIQQLKQQPNTNSSCHFNSFGLGKVKSTSYYYPRYQSFYNRTTSCEVCDDSNKQSLEIRTGKEYTEEHNIEMIDFLKIDTEGFELQVIQGFGDLIEKIKIIQFEYGGTFLDNHITLAEVVHYLEEKGFSNFSYLTGEGQVPLTDLIDHYQYCNIVCIHSTCKI